MTKASNHIRHAVAANAASIATSFSMNNSGQARQRNHRLKHLVQPGSEALLNVSAARQGFTIEQYRQAHRLFSPAHYQMGGDDALIYNTKLNEFLPSSMVMPLSVNNTLPRAINNDIAALRCMSKQANSETLIDYINQPTSRVQGVMMVHAGKVVFEQYPGMNPDDNHVWMELSRNTVRMVFSQLISEGLVELDRAVSVYLPELLGTNWDLVSVRHALDHTTGLDVTQDLQTIYDPQSNIARFLAAEFGQASGDTTQKEHWLDVIKQIEKSPNQIAGHDKCASAITIAVLTYLAERIDRQPWSTLFRNRVWGHVRATAPMLFTLAPDGTAISHGLVLSTLEDAARFAMLFTPSWSKISTTSTLPKQWHDEYRLSQHPNKSNLVDIFQVDKVFSDGARYKKGKFGQGMYVDPKRDFAAVYFSSQANAYEQDEPYMMGYLRKASQCLG
ncbi:serine hydrolase domain-containing protein [Agarivorans sp. MS3-6]